MSITNCEAFYKQAIKFVLSRIKVVANKDLGCQRKWILTHQHCTTCLPHAKSRFSTMSTIHLAVTEELIKWVWLGLKTVIIVKIIVKIQKRTINSSKIHTPLAQGLV